MSNEPIDFQVYPTAEVATQSAEFIAQKLAKLAAHNTPTAIFLSGGSAIDMYLKVFEFLPAETNLSKLTVLLIDERFGPKGHSDSNEQQLREKGVLSLFEKFGAKFVGMLGEGAAGAGETAGHTVVQSTGPATAQTAAEKYAQVLEESEYVIALAGIGDDGHTAGILPTQSEERFDELYNHPQTVVYYEVDPADSPNPFQYRLTISAPSFEEVDQVIVYAKGDNKRTALEKLNGGVSPLFQTPAGILRTSQEPVLVFTDQNVG